jgi:hypothetical protein
MLDDREDVHAGAGQRDRFEEVRGQRRLGLRAQELRPRVTNIRLYVRNTNSNGLVGVQEFTATGTFKAALS